MKEIETADARKFDCYTRSLFDRYYIFYVELHNAGANTVQIIKSFDTSHKHATIRVCREHFSVCWSCRLVLISTCVICLIS